MPIRTYISKDKKHITVIPLPESTVFKGSWPAYPSISLAIKDKGLGNIDSFEKWLVNYFRVKVEHYCHDLTISFRALLILDNGPEHTMHLNDLHPNIIVTFMTPNTATLIQPMDQKVIVTFKMYWLR